ncbi:MAG: type IV pilus secretin PilQ [Thermoanaerobaculia bacterium]
MIQRLDVAEGAPGSRIALAATSPLVWTSYRDADGDLVVELPNARPDDAVHDLALPDGLVESVRVTVEQGDRPLTRLLVRTRQEAEHSLSAQGASLVVELTPEAGASGEATASRGASAEPVAPVEPVAAEAASAVADAAPPAMKPEATVVVAPAVGTPEHPVVAVAPSGRTADRLSAIEVASVSGGTTVRIAGNGDFTYSTFQLSNPDRFVVDLEGVVNASPQGAVAVDSPDLARVRVSQFKPQPTPVSRVVFDLKQATVPRIERSGDGLHVLFGAAPASAPPVVTARVEPEPASTAPAVREPASQTAPMPEIHAPAVIAEAKPSAAAEAQVEVSDVQAFGNPAPTVPDPAAAPARDLKAYEAAQVEAPTPGPVKTASLQSTFGNTTVGGKKREYVGEPISLSLKDADIKDVLRSFAKISGLNVVVQPDVRGTVTVELDSVPWDQALDQILKINDLGYELDGNIMRVARLSKLEAEAKQARALAAEQAQAIPLRTIVKRVSYSDVNDIARILQSSGGRTGNSILSARGSITVDRRTNTLIIKELPTYIDTIIAVIETLDVPEPQVMIEARIVETTKNFNRTLGIRWGFEGLADAAHGNTTGLVFPNNVDAIGGVNLLTGGNNGLLSLTLGNVLNTFKLDATLLAAESEGLINVLSAPKISVLNNEQASIQSGLQIPIQTVANNTVTVQYVNATLRLEVTPHVTAEGTVLMDLTVQKREPQLAFAVTGAANAPINTKEAKTRVIVRDGGTSVIGGIYKVTTNQGQDRVPGLANVPILGHLFKNHKRSDANEELLIFITPRVVKL